MENEKMPYHLAITDNETGETVQELDFDVIIGAVHIAERHSQGIFVANASVLSQAETIAAAEATVKNAIDDDPLLRFSMGLVNAKATEEDHETEETPEGQA